MSQRSDKSMTTPIDGLDDKLNSNQLQNQLLEDTKATVDYNPLLHFNHFWWTYLRDKQLVTAQSQAQWPMATHLSPAQHMLALQSNGHQLDTNQSPFLPTDHQMIDGEDNEDNDGNDGGYYDNPQDNGDNENNEANEVNEAIEANEDNEDNDGAEEEVVAPEAPVVPIPWMNYRMEYAIDTYYTCLLCDLVNETTDENAFRRHIEDHLKGIRPFWCQVMTPTGVCNKRFNFRSNCRNHVMTHCSKRKKIIRRFPLN